MKKEDILYTPTPEEAQEYLAYETEQDIFDNLSGGLESLENMHFEPGEKKTKLIAGAMVAFDKGTVDFLNKLAKKDTEYKYVLLSEVTAEFRRKTRECIEFEHVCTPHLLAKEIRLLHFAVSVPEEVEGYVRQREYLIRAQQNLLGRHKDMEESYAEVLVYYADQYITRLLEIVQPEVVILWNQFYAFHMIFAQICKRKRIEIQYMEFGCVPGTFVLEREGQQGESYPAKHPQEFKQLAISRQELLEAGAVSQYIYKACLNRNVQPPYGKLDETLVRYRSGRPVIAYFGQNDYESGLFPYTEDSRRYHSPFLQSSKEGLELLHLLSIKNNWTLLYKPHPLIASLGTDRGEGEVRNCVRVHDMNIHEVIDCADVVVTVLSQSAYEALFRDKPVVMMGYTQLRGSGAVYEAYGFHKVERTIKKALRRGYTRGKKQCFMRHLACLLKYCLMDDRSHPDFLYGMAVGEFINKWNTKEIF
ncbi:hypothetical protein AALA13_07440 [Lachnospiraceae bacterium 50-23]